MVLVPGLVAGSWMWEQTRVRLSDAGYACLSILDPIAANHDTVQGAADALLDRFDAFDIERGVIFGGSLGSLVALTFAAQHPHRVSTLVLSGAPTMNGGAALGITSYGKLTRAIAFAAADRLFVDRACIDDRMIDMTLSLFLERRRLANMVRLLREANTVNMRELLPRVRMPALMIWGEDDEISPCADWESLLPLLRHGSLVRIPRCGHLPMIERAREFNAAVFDYLEGSPSAEVELGA